MCYESNRVPRCITAQKCSTKSTPGVKSAHFRQKHAAEEKHGCEGKAGLCCPSRNNGVAPLGPHLVVRGAGAAFWKGRTFKVFLQANGIKVEACSDFPIRLL